MLFLGGKPGQKDRCCNIDTQECKVRELAIILGVLVFGPLHAHAKDGIKPVVKESGGFSVASGKIFTD